MKTFFLSLMTLATLTLTACSGQILTKDSEGGAATNTVNLEQDFQEVIHTDCNNQIVADRIETVSTPTQWVTINPSSWANLSGSTFLNTATGSTAPMVSNFTTFVVDHGDGALSMHVNSGYNKIAYKFYTCDAKNADGSCAHPQTISETGTVTFNVNYIEKTLAGAKTVSDCAPQPSPTP